MIKRQIRTIISIFIFLTSTCYGAILKGEFLLNEKNNNDLVINSRGEADGKFISNNGSTYTINNKSSDRFGKSGKTMLLNATEFDRIEIKDSNNAGIIPKDKLSISFWFNARSFSTENTLISQYEEDANGSFEIYINNTITPTISIRLGPASALSGSTVITENKWYFFCILRDSDSIRLYLTEFGQQFNTMPEIEYTGTGFNQPLCSQPTIIGLASNHPFDGSIDSVRIWDGALHIQEIEALYNEEPYWVYKGNTKALNSFDCTALSNWEVVEEPNKAKPGDILWQELFEDELQNEWITSYCNVAKYSACAPIDFSIKGGFGLRAEKTNESPGYCTLERAYTDIPDVTKCYMRLRYFIPSYSKQTYLIEVCISDSINNKRRHINTLPVTAGHHYIEFAHGCMDIKDTYNYAFDYSKIQRIQINIWGELGTIVYFDSIEFVTNYHRPRILLSWDNGLPKMYTYVRQELNKRGIKGNFFVNGQREVEGEYFGVYGDMMTPEQLLEMHAEGHLIGNHTHEHKRAVHDASTYYSGRFPAFEIHEDIMEQVAYLRKIGIKEGRFFLAVPSSNGVTSRYSEYTARQELYRFLLQHAYCVIMGKFHSGADGVICGTKSTSHYTFPNPGTSARIQYRDCYVYTFDSNYVSVEFEQLTTAPFQGAVLVGNNGGSLVLKKAYIMTNTIEGYLTGSWKCGDKVSMQSGEGSLNPSSLTVTSITSKGFMTAKKILDRCKEHNEIFAPAWHSVGPGEYTFDMTEDEFEAMLDYAIEQGFEFVTYADLMPWNLTTNGDVPNMPDPNCLKYPKMDFNKDCKVDFSDFAEFAAEWLDCNLR